MSEERGIISKYQSEADIVFEWKISNFFALPEEDGVWYFSPEFSFSGEEWYLWIFPNGFRESDSSGHVDVWLCKCDSSRSTRQSFSLSLKTAKGKKRNEEHFTKDFNNWPEHRHEFRRFIRRSELTTRKSELCPEGALTVVCTMKNTTSAESDNSEKEEVINSTRNSGFAEYYTPDSDSAERSSDLGECCHKCSNCLDIIKKQKKLLEELENAKKRSEGVESLCQDYKKVLLAGRHHDLILKVGDKELRAHRDILRARSRVFESMLDHDMKEKNTGIIDVPDCDPDAMELFLSYVYCRKIEALDHSNMFGLYYIADKYEMMELKRECCNFIKKSLSLTNICSVIQLALKHSDSDLLEYATGYFSDNMLDIMKTVEWQSFLKDNSTVGNELLIKSIELKNAQN